MGDRAVAEALGGAFADVGEAPGEARVDRLSAERVDVLWGRREVAVAHHDVVDSSPVVGVGSDVEGDAGADAELVALGIGHRNPGDVVALADVHPPSAQLLGGAWDFDVDVGEQGCRGGHCISPWCRVTC